MNREEIISYIIGKDGIVSEYVNYNCIHDNDDNLLFLIKGIYLSEEVFKKHNEMFKKLNIIGELPLASMFNSFTLFGVYTKEGFLLDTRMNEPYTTYIKQFDEVIELYDEIHELCNELQIFGVDIR